MPATIIPIAIAAFAAYAFAWIDFKGRKPLFIATVALLAIPTAGRADPAAADVRRRRPPHAPVPRQDDHAVPRPRPGRHDHRGVADAHRRSPCRSPSSCCTTTSRRCPRTCSRRRASTAPTTSRSSGELVLPLSVPVLAAFAIFQFLWTWNDYLIANSSWSAPTPTPCRRPCASPTWPGDFGRNEHLLPAGAFVQAFVPTGRVLRCCSGSSSAASSPAPSRADGADAAPMAGLIDASPRRLGSLARGRTARPSGSGGTPPTTRPMPRRWSRPRSTPGMNLIDTADVYGLDWGGTGFGSVEELLGRGARRAPALRDRMVLATKGGIRAADAVRLVSPPCAAAGVSSARCAGSASTSSTCTRSIGPTCSPIRPTWPRRSPRCATRARSARSACRNHTPAQVAALQAHLPFPLVTNQPEYSAAHLDPLRDGTLDACMRDGIVPLAWSPLAGGRLATRRRDAARAARRARRARRARGRRPGDRRAGVRARPSVGAGGDHRHPAPRADQPPAPPSTSTSTGPTSTPSSRPRRGCRCHDR